MSIFLPNLIPLWPNAAFTATLKSALESLSIDAWPLDAGGGITVVEGSLSMTILTVQETPAGIEARIGVFYDTLLAGCACGDEPATTPAYTTLCAHIDRYDGRLRLTPAA